MNTHKMTARIVGALFITATVTAILGYEVILRPILSAPDFLVAVSANSALAITGVLIASLNSVAVVAIPVLLFPIFKKQYETLAIGYIVGRCFEGLLFIVGFISLLSLVTISQEYSQAASEAAANFQAVGTLLLAVHDWTFLLGVTFVLGLSALILNYVLYQAKLVPRWISAWGLIAGILLLVEGLFEIFGFSQAILALPIALQEMVMALWLIAKGWNPEAIEPPTIDSRAAGVDMTGTMSPTVA